MNKIHLFCIVLLTFTLTGCDKASKTILTGNRELVFDDISDLKPDPSPLETMPKSSLPLAQENMAWPVAGGTSHHVMPSVLLNHNLQEVWRVNIGTGSSEQTRLLNGPIGANGRVFTIDAESRVSAIDIQSGKILWQSQVVPDNQPTQPFGGGLAYNQGRIFVATASAEILALNESDGQIIWRQRTTAPIRSAPCVHENQVYVVTINNQTEAFRAADGSLLWNHTGTLEVAGLLGGASPAAHKDVVIAAYTSGEIFALRPENGYPLWSESLGSTHVLDSVAALSHIKARPIIAGDHVILISHGGRMVTLDLRSGKQVWSRDIAGIRSPSCNDAFIYLVTKDSQLLCLNLQQGTILWVNKLLYKNKDSEDKILWAGPILTSQGLALTATNGQIIFCNPLDGQITQTLQLDQPVSTSPIVMQKTLLVLTDNAQLVAFK